MPHATVKFFWRERGYGFLVAEGPQDLYFHAKDCLFPEDELRTGIVVRFKKILARGKPRAVKITKLGEGDRAK